MLSSKKGCALYIQSVIIMRVFFIPRARYPQKSFYYLMCISLPFQYREERFRSTSESTNQRVLWWSLAQTCILVVMGAWQMRHLKSFFEAKKLV